MIYRLLHGSPYDIPVACSVSSAPEGTEDIPELPLRTGLSICFPPD